MINIKSRIRRHGSVRRDAIVFLRARTKTLKGSWQKKKPRVLQFVFRIWAFNVVAYILLLCVC
jgi:hypothetical protein